MNTMNMNGANMPNGVTGNMAAMNNTANGAPQRREMDETEFKVKLNTYIYDYFLKNQQYDCARTILNSSLVLMTRDSTQKKRNDDAMETDSKDDIDLKKPGDLPLPSQIPQTNTDNSFLLDWFTLFWEIFLAPRQGKTPKINPNAVNYTNHIREQSRQRQEAQNNFLRQPGVPANMQQQYNMMRMQQQMPSNMNDIRNRLGHPRQQLTPQQQQQLLTQNRLMQQHQQQQQQQQMERGGSEVDMNGQRPRSPSSAMMPMDGMPAEFYQNAQMRQGVPQNPNGGNHALQDYQLQLMLLEQQNKKRLLMARQEQDNMRPDQQPHSGGVPQFQAVGMSPQGSRSGPSPNPSEQMKRGTPKMAQAGLPGSPMPDGNMPNRGSPGAMNFSGGSVPVEMMPGMSGKMDGMPMGPNGPMRPPSSHPQGFNVPMQQQLAQMRQAQQNGQMSNGANWQQGPQGQAGMMNPQAQQMQPQQPQPPQQPGQPGQPGQQPGQPGANPQAPGQMGTPQQRNAAMPPPQNLPAGGAVTNGRPASPAQSAASSTPQQTNKPNPKKKDAKEPRKRPTKKATTAATPSAEGDNPPPTPTPQTPITPMNKGFTDQAKNAPQQNANAQAPANAPAPNQPLAQNQSEPMMNQFDTMDGEMGDVTLDFGPIDSGDVLNNFDFEAFLQDDTNADFDMGGFTYDSLEAGGDAA